MWADPAALLAGPRGRRLCWSLLEDRLPGSFRMSVWPGEARPGPAGVAAVLTRAAGGAGLERLGATSDPTAFLPALAAAVGSVLHWQPPDETDQILADPRVREALVPVAEAVAAAPGAAWWGEPIARDEQYEVNFAGGPGGTDPGGGGTDLGPGAPEPGVGGAGPGVGGPTRLPAASPRTALRRWRADTLADERAAAERPADLRANWTGHWWSAPVASGLPTSTRALGATGPVGLSLVEDEQGWTSARCRRLRPRSAARVFEIAGPEDFADLVRRYPLPVARSRRHDWWRTTGEDRAWAIPDYPAVAEDYDAVHLSVLGYLTAAGRAIPVGGAIPAGSAHPPDRATLAGRASAAGRVFPADQALPAQAPGSREVTCSVLAGWNPDQTSWLTECVVAEVAWTQSVLLDRDDALAWRPAP